MWELYWILRITLEQGLDIWDENTTGLTLETFWKFASLQIITVTVVVQITQISWNMHVI